MKNVYIVLLIILLLSACQPADEKLFNVLSTSDDVFNNHEIDNLISQIDFSDAHSYKAEAAAIIFAKGSLEQIKSLFKQGLSVSFLSNYIAPPGTENNKTIIETIIADQDIETLEYLYTKAISPIVPLPILIEITNPSVFNIIESNGFSILDTHKTHYTELFSNGVLKSYLLNHKDQRIANYAQAYEFKETTLKPLFENSWQIKKYFEDGGGALLFNFHQKVKRKGFGQLLFDDYINSIEHTVHWHVLLCAVDSSLYEQYLDTLSMQKLTHNFKYIMDYPALIDSMPILLELYINRGIDINTTTDWNYRRLPSWPLKYAVQAKDSKHAISFIKQGANINQQDVYYAIKTKHFDVLELMQEKGVDLNTTIVFANGDGHWGYSESFAPIFTAIKKADTDAVKALHAMNVSLNGTYSYYEESIHSYSEYSYNTMAYVLGYLNPEAAQAIINYLHINNIEPAEAFYAEESWIFDLGDGHKIDIIKEYPAKKFCYKKVHLYEKDKTLYVDYTLYNLRGYMEKQVQDGYELGKYMEDLEKLQNDNIEALALEGTMTYEQFQKDYFSVFVTLNEY